jgi:hypothetical protein
LLIDLTLLLGIVLTSLVLRDRRDVAANREQTLLRQMLPSAPPPMVPALPALSPATAAAYMEVAQNFVFSRDRNPNVILDPPAPPPPPKPMPPLPLAYGIIDLGGGATIILSERSGGQHRSYRPGESIGEFKLVAINGREVHFEWDGKPVRKQLDELLDKRAREAPAPAEQPAAQSAAAPTATTLAPVKAGPGVELGQDSRACVPGDTNPAGTVKDGFRKVVSKTPFGDSCRWEAIKQ